MALTLQDIKNLIRVAQSGDGVAAVMARTDILIEIQNEHMERHIYKYTRKNTVGGMDADDIRQIFLIACSIAIDEADVDKGNPLLFILQRGKWKVVDELRKTYRRNIRQYCHACETETRVHEKNHVVQCPKCGATGDVVERIQVNFSDDGTLSAFVVDESIDMAEAANSRLVVDEFRARLDGRKADVFDLIINQGYDRDSCTNYIREVAEILGVTPANVNKRLRQIKEEWALFVEEKCL
jgi:RNA polymerase sigma factor (sigma-70 family)